MTQKFIGAADDLAATRALCHEYCRGVIAFDANAIGATYADEGRWARPDSIVVGREAIIEAAAKILANFDTADFVAHLNDTHVEGDRATGRCYHTEVFGKDGAISFYLSHYDDVYVKREGTWRFLERRFTLLEQRRFQAEEGTS